MAAFNLLSLFFAVMMGLQLQRNFLTSAANLRGATSSTSKSSDGEILLHLSDDDDIQYYQYQYNHGYLSDEYFENQLMESEQWFVFTIILRNTETNENTRKEGLSWMDGIVSSNSNQYTCEYAQVIVI